MPRLRICTSPGKHNAGKSKKDRRYWTRMQTRMKKLTAQLSPPRKRTGSWRNWKPSGIEQESKPEREIIGKNNSRPKSGPCGWRKKNSYKRFENANLNFASRQNRAAGPK